MDCIFCKIVHGQIPAVKVYEDDSVLAFADINPITRGHTLVVPKSHAQSIFDIPADTLAFVQKAAQKIAMAVKKVTNAPGMVVLQLNGPVAGQVVMHYHLHLVPRYDGDNVTSFDWTPQPGDMDDIQQTADKIKEAI